MGENQKWYWKVWAGITAVVALLVISMRGKYLGRKEAEIKHEAEDRKKKVKESLAKGDTKQMHKEMMEMLKRKIPVILICFFCLGIYTQAEGLDESFPEKCPDGLVCYTPEQDASIKTRIIELEERIKLLKLRCGRFTLVGGCGGGVSAFWLDGDLTFGATPHCGFTYGISLLR